MRIEYVTFNLEVVPSGTSLMHFDLSPSFQWHPSQNSKHAIAIMQVCHKTTFVTPLLFNYHLT